MPKLYLTDAFVNSLRRAETGDQELYWDYPQAADGSIKAGAVQGLGVRVTAQGIKSFVHSYRHDGKRRRMALGHPANMNVAAARRLVAQRNTVLQAGDDPDAERAGRQQFKTVADVIDGHWEARIVDQSATYRARYVALVAQWRKEQPRTDTRRGRNKRRGYRDFGSLYRGREFRKLKPVDIEAYLRQFPTAPTHNMALAMVKSLFNWAIRMQLVDMRNPCDPIRPRKVIRRRRDYTLAEIKTIAGYIFQPPLEPLPSTADLSGLSKQKAALTKGRVALANAQMVEFCNFMGMLLLTMARPNELMRAEFGHFDLERLIWHKHDTKGIKLSRAVSEYAYRSVPIHPRVAELVQAQRQRWPESDLVFPSHTDITQPRDNFRKSLARFKALPGVPEGFQVYDLKRIAISLMLTAHGVNREAVSHYTDHKGRLETTMLYDLGLVEPLRPVTRKLGELLDL